MKLLLTTLVVPILMFQPVDAQQRIDSLENVQPVAIKALTTFRKLVTEKNYKTLGLKSLGEEKDASLGDPLQLFMIRLDQLQKYEIGSDPAGLLSGGESAIYPVIISNQVRSSIELEKTKEAWQATNFGQLNLIKMLTKVRSQAADTTKLPIVSFFAVRVPALNLYFIAYRIDDALMLTPVLDDPGYGFKAGVPMSAKKVFEAILPAAKASDGLPG